MTEGEIGDYNMKKDKHIFINYRLFLILLGLILGIVFIFSTLEFGNHESNEIGIIIIILLSIFIILGILFDPHYCKITPKGVEIGYFFGVKASAEWNNIREIYITSDRSFDVLNVYEYVFIGLKCNCKYPLLKEQFYVSKKMTRLLEQYAKNKMK